MSIDLCLVALSPPWLPLPSPLSRPGGLGAPPSWSPVLFCSYFLFVLLFFLRRSGSSSPLLIHTSYNGVAVASPSPPARVLSLAAPARISPVLCFGAGVFEWRPCGVPLFYSLSLPCCDAWCSLVAMPTCWLACLLVAGALEAAALLWLPKLGDNLAFFVFCARPPLLDGFWLLFPAGPFHLVFFFLFGPCRAMCWFPVGTGVPCLSLCVASCASGPGPVALTSLTARVLSPAAAPSAGQMRLPCLSCWPGHALLTGGACTSGTATHYIYYIYIYIYIYM